MKNQPYDDKSQYRIEPKSYLCFFCMNTIYRRQFLYYSSLAPYATTIETRKELVDNNPNLVQRFVDASIAGWYSYLENPEPGNKLIKEANPEMTDEQLAYSWAKMQEYGLVISGDAQTKGIGAMTEARWQSLFATFVEIGVFKPDIDYKQAFTVDFVNKGVGANVSSPVQ